MITVSGTFSGTLQAEASGDGVNFSSIAITPLAGGSSVTAVTGVGNWQTNAAGVVVIRMRASTLASGSAVVNLQASTASARSGGSGGGGGGTVTSVTGSAPIVSSGGNTPAISCPTCNTSANSVTTIAGTSNQITSSSSTGAITLSIPSVFTFPGTVTNNLSIFSATTSAQLSGVISDGVGTGLAIFSPSNLPVGTVATNTSTTYYVDNIHGNDSNNGTSPSTAWATISHVNGQTFSAGQQVLFLRGDVWHEMLIIPSSGSSAAPFTVGNYGPLTADLPIVDGSDVITGWTVQSGTTYEAAYTSTAYKGFVDSLYIQTIPLVLQTSIANVNSTAGSIYSDGTHVYVHLLDGSNPSNHTIEVSGSRHHGVEGLNLNYVVINGLKVIRAYDAGIAMVGTLDNSAPTLYNADNTIENCVLFNIGNLSGVGIFNATGSIFVSGDIAASQIALVGWKILNNNIGIMDVPTGQNTTIGGLQIHNTTGALLEGNTITTVNAMGIQMRSLFANTTNDSGQVLENTLLANEGNVSAQGATSLVSKNMIHDSLGFGVQTGATSTISHNLIYNLNPSTDGGLYNGIDENAVTNGFIIDNSISNITMGCALDIENSATGWNVQGNTIDASGSGCVLYIPSVSVSGLVLNSNIYIEKSGTTTGFHYGGTSGTVITRVAFWASAPEAGGDVQNPQINGGSFPVSATFVGSNSSGQPIAAGAQYSKGQCTEVWGGSGTSFALTSGDDAISNNSCYNDSGVTRTITAVKCRDDVVSNTTTVNPVFGASGTGTTILSGALTCGSSLAYSSTGTVTNAAWTTGTGINPVMAGTLTGTSIAMLVEYTF